MIIAGIDEAGYGPLLGPLVVSAAAVEVAGAAVPMEVEELPCIWRLLKGAVAKKTPVRRGRILIADSKVVHNLQDGNRQLERGVLAFWRALQAQNGGANEDTASALQLMDAFGCANHELAVHPWYAPHDVTVPWLADAADLAISTNMLMLAMLSASVRPACMRTRVVSERAFNRLVGGTNNKASALVSITLDHLYYLHTRFGTEGLVVGIDKQGGRDYYTSLLLQSFPDAQLKVLSQAREISSYLLQEKISTGQTRTTVLHFREKGETAFLPTALASMMCKYLRELCMYSFNSWWCGQISGLRPTAGYHQDGSRWLIDVEPHLGRLGIAKEMLVRVR